MEIESSDHQQNDKLDLFPTDPAEYKRQIVSCEIENKSDSLLSTSGGSRIFPRGGREPSRGGVNTPNFPENCMKSKEFGRPGGGRASLTPPPRSANVDVNKTESR